MLPKENYTNKLYELTTYNQYMVNVLNPFHPMFNMVVTIEYPVLPDFSCLTDKEKKKAPNVELFEYLTLLPEFRELIEQKGDIYHLALVLLDISKELVVYDVVKSDNLYKYLVILHLGSMLKEHIRDFKDEARLVSLNGENVEKHFYFNDMVKLMGNGEKDGYLLNSYGERFTRYYMPLVEAYIKGGYTKYGKIRI